MTSTQLQTIRRAISLLSGMIDEPQESAGIPSRSPVRRFVQEFIVADANADITSEEAWQFFKEIAVAGELQPLGKSIFLRQLPIAIQSVYNIRKSHHVQRNGRRMRGFKDVTIKLETPCT